MSQDDFDGKTGVITAPGLSGGTATRPLSLIVIEDEPLVALSIRDTVEELGHTVCGVARNESEAIDIVRAKRPDLALMNAHLPGAADGIEVARRLNAGFGIRTVFLTAHSDHATMDRITSSRPLGVVSKPFSRTQIRATLELAARRLRMPAAAANGAAGVTPE